MITVIESKDLKFDILRHSISFKDEKTFDLSNFEFRIFLYLIKNKDMVSTRAQILEAVWGLGINISDRVIDKHISVIRNKIYESGIMIIAVRDVGYRLILPEIEQ